MSRAARKLPRDGAGVLLFGTDAMRVALERQAVVAALAGPQADEEMRLTRLSGSDLSSEPAAVLDGLKSVGFFPGPRVVFVDGVLEVQAKLILAALDAWAPDDATLVVTAGNLKKTSKLRAAFESHPRAVALAIYEDAMDRDALEAAIAEAGLRLTPEARGDVDALAAALGPGELRQTLAKIALYAGAETADARAVAAMSPATIDAEADDVVLAAAAGNAGAVGPLMRRLSGQGVNPVTIVITATRLFRQIHGIATDAARPYGPHGRALTDAARAWGVRRLEAALVLLMETDLTLRSASRAPQMAVMERALIRLAMMARA